MSLMNVKILILLMMISVHRLCAFFFCYFYLLLYHCVIRTWVYVKQLQHGKKGIHRTHNQIINLRRPKRGGTR